MCLAKITKVLKRGDVKSGFGYKAVLVDKGSEGGEGDEVFTDDKRFPLNPIGEWNRAVPSRVTTDAPCRAYKTGFHIWATKPAAEQWTSRRVAKVEYRKARIIGCQHSGSGKLKMVIVADEMRVVKVY